MKRKQYQKEAIAGESPIQPDIPNSLLHGVIGVCTEAGELQDAVKKAFYGQPIDYDNIIEELGDLEWYMAVIRGVVGVTQEEVQRRNNEKLKRRYKEGFSTKEAIERNDKKLPIDNPPYRHEYETTPWPSPFKIQRMLQRDNTAESEPKPKIVYAHTKD